MTKSPFSPFLALTPVVKSITYALSMAGWRTNPPPATNLIESHRLADGNRQARFAFGKDLGNGLLTKETNLDARSILAALDLLAQEGKIAITMAPNGTPEK